MRRTNSKIGGSGGIRTHDQRPMSPMEPLQSLNNLSVTQIAKLQVTHFRGKAWKVPAV